MLSASWIYHFLFLEKLQKKKNLGGGGGGVGIRYVPVPNKGYSFYEGLTPNRVSFLPLLALFSWSLDRVTK